MSPGEDLQSKASELVKKVIGVGVGAIFLTEESLRNLVSELKIPKELLGSILENAGKTRREFLNKLSSDVLDRVLQRVEPRALLDEILAKHEIEISVRLSFKPKSKKESDEEKPESEPGEPPASV